MTAVGHARSSLAGGMIKLPEAVGGALGLAVATTIAAITSERGLDSTKTADGADLNPEEIDVVHGALSNTEPAAEALASVPPHLVAELQEAIRDTFVAGLSAGYRIVAILAVIGLAVSLIFVGGRIDQRRPAGVA